MSVWKVGQITTYKEFCSAFVKPEQRRQFLLDCARQGFQSIVRAWPDKNMRIFVFGSAANKTARVGADSDLDIAISGDFDDIAEERHKLSAALSQKFREGLAAENQLLPIDMLTINATNPQTCFAKEIVENGIEIKMD